MGSSSFGDLLVGAGLAFVLLGAGCAAEDTAGTDHAGVVVGGPMGAPVGGISGGLTPSGGVTPGAGSGGVVPAGTMPCEVSSVVQARCHTCHGARPIGGAPMSLVTLADFHRDYTAVSTTQLAGRAYKMYELARIRINREQGTAPMPQAGQLQGSELSTLSTWLTSGAPAGAACGASGGAGTGTIGTPPAQAGMGGVAGFGVGTGGSGTSGTGTEGPARIDDQCDQPGAFDPLVANSPEETCYDFRTHGRSGTGDTSKFNIPTGETYNQFYFAIPWEDGAEATRFGTDYDNREVLHHWLMFGQQLGMSPGTVEPGVLGTTLFTDAELISGWAVGGCTTTYPQDVGFKLPTTGVIMVQWHHYNYTGSTTQDASAAQICTVPGGTRPHTAGVTFLGTEVISVPPGTTGNASGTCTNDSGGPITIFTFTPHMHEIGINMKSEVMRAAGGSEVVFDMPFQFDYQTNYMMNPYVVLQPGDRIKSTCTYQNETLGSVGFGQSTKAEMCYQFAISYPYGALNNGVPSLIGATNTCW
jgi:hypothetical protein